MIPTSFPQMFFTWFSWENFCHSEHFVENKKRWKSLGAWSDEYDRGSRTDQPKSNIFFRHDSCWMWLCVIMKKHEECRFFKRFSGTQCSCREYKFTLSVWLQFKNSKLIVPVIPPYTQHNFSIMKLYIWGKLQRFIPANPKPVALKIVIRHIFDIHNDILEKQLISLLWKKTYHYGYAIFLIFFTKK